MKKSSKSWEISLFFSQFNTIVSQTALNFYGDDYPLQMVLQQSSKHFQWGPKVYLGCFFAKIKSNIKDM